jgi:hypothetical protein
VFLVQIMRPVADKIVVARVSSATETTVGEDWKAGEEKVLSRKPDGVEELRR